MNLYFPFSQTKPHNGRRESRLNQRQDHEFISHHPLPRLFHHRSLPRLLTVVPPPLPQPPPPSLHHPPPPYAVTPQGLDLRAVNSLPTFIYESENHETPLECAVCLSEFQNGETGRILPDCKHCFHIDCVDTWLQSRRDCPLCRTRVKGRPVGNLVSIFLLDGSGRGSGRDPTCSPSTPSSSQDLDATKESTGPDSEPDQDPNELLGRALNPDPGYRVTRFWL